MTAAKKPPRGRDVCPMCEGHGHVPQASIDDVRRVWTVYATYHPKAVRSPARMTLIRRRLQHYPADRLIAAIHGNHQDQHCRDHNYHDLELILRDAGHVERYEEKAVGAGFRSPAGNGPGGSAKQDRQRIVPPGLEGVLR